MQILSNSTAFGKIVEVKVGKELDTNSFWLHEGVVSFYSGYFDKAFNGHFKEAQTGLVQLPDSKPSIFEMVQYWMYNRRFQQNLDGDRSVIGDNLIDLWIFGDSHDIPLLQNAAVDALHAKVLQTLLIPGYQVHYIYDNTLAGARLRHHFIDVVGKLGIPESIIDLTIECKWSEEALRDLLRVVSGSELGYPGKNDMFHENGIKCAEAGK